MDRIYPSSLGELAERMGMEIVDATPEAVIVRIPVVGNRQGLGFLHGGANGVVVEHAGSVLAGLHSPEGRVPVGTELSVSQLRAVTGGHVTARATVVSVGRSSMCAHVEVRTDDGELNAVGRMTTVYVPDPNRMPQR